MTVPKHCIQPSENPAVETTGDKRSAIWDELCAAVTSRLPKGINASSLAAYGWLALLILANAVVSMLSSAHDAAQRGALYDLRRPAYFEITGGLCTLLLLPALRHGVHSLIRFRGWFMTIGAASLIASLYAVAHIAILIPVRKATFFILGGSYHFDWLSQGPYDFRREIIVAMVLGGAFWLFDRNQPEPSDVTRPEPLPEQPSRIWLRDGTTAVRVDPRAIVTVSSAGNYVEYSLPDKTYLIRGTLAGEEVRLRTFGLRRVHRTRLVNLHHVAAVEPRAGGDFIIRMDNGESISGSRRYREAVRTITALPG
jgi:hypothetical protein